jgi:DNA-3-methyladenine glycosylase II
MKTLDLSRPKGFSLAAAADFYAGFTPGSGMAAARGDHLTLAFRLDGTFEAVVVALHEDGASIVGEYTGTRDEATLSKQLTRILGTDVDGDAWSAVGRRDPVVGKLQAEFPGFFTAAKPSPYDAAAWGVLSPRMPMRAAANLKMAIAKEHGSHVRLLGGDYHVFPSPLQVARIESFPGLSAEKLVRLKGVALAALDGKLDPDRLRAMNDDDALADLMTLRGVGPWSASHILYRGAALPDALPTGEPRLLHGLAEAYGIASPTVEDLERLAESWRPFRMWVCILLARHLGRVGGWNKPGLSRERAAAGKALIGRRSRPRTQTRAAS